MQGDIRSEAQGKSKTNGSPTDEWTLKDVGVEWQHTREYTHTHTHTKGYPKPSERQVNMVCSWTMTFSCWGGLDQPSRWPLGPHARSPWLADGAELLNHSVSWYVFWYAGLSDVWLKWRGRNATQVNRSPFYGNIYSPAVHFIRRSLPVLGTY